TGNGPLSPDRVGQLSFDLPDRVRFVEPFPRRVRAVRGGQIVVDSAEVALIHESGQLPRYLFPAKHVHVEAERHPEIEDHVLVEWDAVDAWFEEDERVLV